MRMSLALVSRSSMAMRRGRGKRRRRGDVAPEISWDLMIEILTRLPAKSLMRFKCVSKLWLSLIRSRYFSNRYLTVPRPPRLYVSWLDSVDHLGCDSMEVCHPVDSVLLSLSLSTTSRATSFDLDLTMPGMGGHGLFILRGLILYVVCTKACIYNPATRQSVTLPAVKSNLVAQKVHEKFVFYFLGHDPVLDQYKVVCTILICPDDFFIPMTSEHWVFLLESGGSWRKIVFGQPHYPKGPQLCIDGVIYYIAAATNTPHDILVSFDVRSEEVSMIQAPLKRLSSKSGRPTGFIEYGGKPTIFDQTHFAPQGLVDLWVLEDGDEKWLKTSLALQPCQMHFVNNDDSADFMVDGTTRNGQVILTPTPMVSPSYFLYYDLQKNDLRKIDIRGVRDHGLSKPNADYASYWALMDKGESIMHLET